MRTRSEEALRATCVRALALPRYRGEAAYVPYYWRAHRRGRRAARWGSVLGFEVTAEDRAIFPELARVDVVAIRQTEGRVHETSPEDAAWDTLRGK